MAGILELSARIIDENRTDEQTNRVTQQLTELGDGVALVESFSHLVAVRSPAGELTVFDTSSRATAPMVVEALRAWSTAPVTTAVYTHGHVDHVGGSGVLRADAEERGHPRPEFVAHESVPVRFDRYRYTDGYNQAVNARQFGGGRKGRGPAVPGIGGGRQFLPADVVEPDVVFEESLTLDLGGEPVELRHGRGETDDHLWAWFPERRLLCAGDFFIWNFPNAGNPQKVQRYPLEWAGALREMAAAGPELFVPAHGLPIGGRDRIVAVLEEVAGVLEVLVADTVALMNEGATLDRIVHEVQVPAESLARPFLVPRYDEPEFVVRNIWRLYGGWYDGNPAHLKPAPQPAVSRELAALAGGAGALAARAAELAGGDDPEGLRLACHLVEHAVQAAPDDPEIHRVRAEVYRARRTTETSLMARGIYGSAAEDSEARQA